jgi:hypothetical protein
MQPRQIENNKIKYFGRKILLLNEEKLHGNKNKIAVQFYISYIESSSFTDLQCETDKLVSA